MVKKAYTTNNNELPKNTIYQWFEGNLVLETTPDGKETKYSYDNQKPAQDADYLGMNFPNQGYYLIKNKNRLTKVEYEGGQTFTAQYWEDDKGNIKTLTITSSGGVKYTNTFKYQCK